jgi:hypothetical protein
MAGIVRRLRGRTRNQNPSDETARAQRHQAAVTGVFAAYTEWRTDCAAATETYRSWVTAPASEKAAAFAVYSAALDWEEYAANRYASLMRRAGQLQEPIWRTNYLESRATRLRHS